MLNSWSSGFFCVVEQLNGFSWHNEDVDLIMEA